MNCKAFRKQVDIAFGQSGYEITGELLEHANSCHLCSEYLKELKLLQDALNEPHLTVRPSELDDLSFDKIVSAAPSHKNDRRPVRIVRPLRWLVAPAAVSVVAILIIMLAKPAQRNVNNYSGSIIEPYSNLVSDNTLLSSDSLSIQVLSSMAGDDKDLDSAADELLSSSDIDDILSSMSQDELKALYDKIDNLKG